MEKSFERIYGIESIKGDLVFHPFKKYNDLTLKEKRQIFDDCKDLEYDERVLIPKNHFMNIDDVIIMYEDRYITNSFDLDINDCILDTLPKDMADAMIYSIDINTDILYYVVINGNEKGYYLFESTFKEN